MKCNLIRCLGRLDRNKEKKAHLGTEYLRLTSIQVRSYVQYDSGLINEGQSSIARLGGYIGSYSYPAVWLAQLSRLAQPDDELNQQL